MAYTMLKNEIKSIGYSKNTLEEAALTFIRDCCEGLRFDKNKAASIDAENLDREGSSLRANQIPFNMEKDIDRLCLENAVDSFLKSGKKEDAFNVYFCYLEMFVGDYKKTRRMIELLSEFEANGSALLMKHRDHYSHSVYVFVLGLAIYKSNEMYRTTYKDIYKIQNEQEAACHYLQYWGLASLFHDIGYPFELPFEQVCSYFEVDGVKREQRPFVAYHALESFVKIDDKVGEALEKITQGRHFSTTNEMFAYILARKLNKDYKVSEEQMLTYLVQKPTRPDQFGHYMDHAYFSATVLFKKFFEEMQCELTMEHLDSLTAILMHNSLYKFCIANPRMNPEDPKTHLPYKKDGNIPFKAKRHPLAYMLMLCDELQCWDRTAYGRNSKKELHPMGCTFDLSENQIRAVYLYDEKEIGKINLFEENYAKYNQNPQGDPPGLKAYSGMYIKENGKSSFQEDIERIVDLTGMKLSVETKLAEHVRAGNPSYLSDSNYINLYNFAIILNGRWNNAEWKKAKEAGQEEQFLNNRDTIEQFTEDFKELSLEYKLSNINQAKSFAKFLNEIGCFYTDKPVDFELVEKFTEEELLIIGPLEHQRWLQEHYDLGWTYGRPEKEEREFLRQHKDMIPDFDGKSEVSADMSRVNYERLDKAEQDKDTDPMECMIAMLRMFDGLRIYRL